MFKFEGTINMIYSCETRESLDRCITSAMIGVAECAGLVSDECMLAHYHTIASCAKNRREFFRNLERKL